MLGDTPLRYSGYTAWRGVAPYTLDQTGASLRPGHDLVDPGGGKRPATAWTLEDHEDAIGR